MVAKILITPNSGSVTAGQDPTIKYQGTGNSTDITQRVTSVGAISFEGASGQLFSITDSLSDSIFSVNDISGIPSIEVLDTGAVKLAQYNGSVGIGKEPETGFMLDVNGTVRATNFVGTITNITGIAAIVNGGTGASTAADALTALGAYPASNPNKYNNGYDIYNFINGKPLVNEVLVRFVVVRAFTCPANLVDSKAFCTTPATATFMIEVLKNNVRVGTLTFAPSASTGVFAAASALTFNAGDQLALRCTNSVADSTLSDIAITIFGTTS